MRLIWKLLREHLSIGEFVVFTIASMIGMAIMLTGIQLYGDIKPMLSGEESLIGNDYMIITKPVKRVGISSTKFTSDEVEEFSNEEFVINLGEFISSQYEVYGSVEFNSQTLSTMMFFEAVADKFIDVETDKWHYNSATKEIPIIIPRNYLNLYNFGFSQTQRLPQITENLIRSVTLGIRLTGNGHRDYYTAHIVGFSDRLNTILVPMEFMEWANDYYAPSSANDSSRLIVEVRNPGDPEVMEYLEAKGYVAEEKAAESSKALFLLQVAIAVIVFIGLVFSILSIIILTLSIYLLIEKNRDKLENLTLIGYTAKYVAKPYNRLTLILCIASLVVSLVAVYIVRQIYIRYIIQLTGIELDNIAMHALIGGAAITFVIIVINRIIISRKLREISCKR